MAASLCKYVAAVELGEACGAALSTLGARLRLAALTAAQRRMTTHLCLWRLESSSGRWFSGNQTLWLIRWACGQRPPARSFAGVIAPGMTAWGCTFLALLTPS